MLSSLRHASSTMARCNDVVDETRQRRNATNKESNNSTPITRKLWRVSIHAMEIIHIRHRNVPPSNNVIIRDEDRRHGPKEDGVAPEESQELRRRGEDLPWNKGPGTDDCSKQLATTDVDVSRSKGHEVVGGGDGVCGYVDTEGDDDETDGGEGGGSAATGGSGFHPFVDDVDGVPHDFSVGGLRSGGSEDTE